METSKFLDLWVDLLTKELSKDEIIDGLLQRWEIERLYNTAKHTLIESRKKKSRNALSRTNRRVIIREIDQGKCQYCGSTVDYFEVDHIKPIDDLGEDSLENVATACHYCNRLKGDRPKEEMRKEIHRRRMEFLLERANFLFETKKGRTILLKMLTENPKE